ncbi:MAG: translation initiation factor IF-2, partial [Acidobacteria bacterium]
ERAELLGKPLSELRARTPARPAPPAPPRRTYGGPGPGSAAGAPPRRRKRKGKQVAAEARPAVRMRPQPDLPPVGEVRISEGITVKDIAERMGRKAKDVITKLFMDKKLVVTINHALDEETAAWVVEAFGGTPIVVGIEEEAIAEVAGPEAEVAGGEPVPRAPVVTMMGHVDHGKTSLLDAIKKTRVAEREAGGITQHIGAYKVEQVVEGEPREIVFLDTPGHEAFTLMRARGATVTDIIVLVVAADDGVMPQTIEAINHARSAGVPLIVAVNKIDKPGANPDRVLQQLAEHDVLVEQFGGDVVACNVSAKTLEGIDHLLEMIVLQAELLELKADPDRPATGTVLEARLDKTRGPVATVLVQNGTLRVGDVFIVGSILGRVRALVDERDRRLEEAGPSTPVQVLGLDDVPQAGDQLQVFVDEQRARQIAMYRQQKLREEQLRRRQTLPSLESLHEQIKAGEVRELPVILKADVQGSVEVLTKALTDLSTDEVQVKVIHAATGAITETDVLLAQASRALIVGFNVRPQRGVRELAEREGVDIRLHTVIYKVTEEIEQAMLATLSPVEKEVYLGRAEVLQTFKVPKVGTIAGCRVVDGVIRRDAQVRLLRDNVVIYEGRVSSLKRFKEDAREVRSGFECGIGLERFNDLKVGDEIEAFRIELVKRESLGERVETTD